MNFTGSVHCIMLSEIIYESNNIIIFCHRSSCTYNTVCTVAPELQRRAHSCSLKTRLLVQPCIYRSQPNKEKKKKNKKKREVFRVRPRNRLILVNWKFLNRPGLFEDCGRNTQTSVQVWLPQSKNHTGKWSIHQCRSQ